MGFLLSYRMDLAYHLGGEFGESRLGLPGGGLEEFGVGGYYTFFRG